MHSKIFAEYQFLSTLSLRRATSKNAAMGKPTLISIHALLAESDTSPKSVIYLLDISIHALLAESDHSGGPWQAECTISIHALLAESDVTGSDSQKLILHFYPRSPCGERLFNDILGNLLKNFYPRSPCGERPTGPPFVK